MSSLFVVRVSSLLSLLFLVSWASADEGLPDVEVSDVRRVFHNGEHNAFTDLTRFQDRYYLTFRSCPDGHMVHPTSSILVLVSDDLRRWQKCFQFSVPLRDTRDPHFLVFDDKLFVYTGTWYSGKTTLPYDEYDLNKHLGFAAWTTDGMDWNGPKMLEGTFGHYIWRAATFGGKVYLCGRRKHLFDMRHRRNGPDVESAMLVSDDALVFKTAALFQERRGDETAFQFLSDGSVLGIARRGRDAAEIVRAKPPYDRWNRRDLDRYVGGPLLARWGDRWVVGGRRNTPDGPRTSLCWLDGDQLIEFAELPSGGDNSYPGFVSLSPTEAAVSWYSSHEKDADGKTITAIYMADLRIPAGGDE